MPFQERRKYPRVDQSVPCQVALGPSIFSTHTKNLSCGGALCQLPKALALMTKLEVDLQLPGGMPGLPARTIRCVGIVVRQEPLEQARKPLLFLTALFFSELKPQDRRHIAEFVLRSMLSHDRRGP